MKKESGSDLFSPDMPNAGPADYLISYLFEFGPILSGSMGSSSLTQQEIESWQRNTGIYLNSWESRMISRLSREYLNESHKATKRDCPSPWKQQGAEVILLKSQDTKNAIRRLAEL